MRVAVLGAGGPAGVNALRALHAAGHECIAVDANKAHLVWCEPYATHCLGHVPVGDADVLLPQPDSLVLWVTQNRDGWSAKTLLPDEGTIWACQDKFSTSLAWWRQGLRELPPVRLCEPWPDHIKLAIDTFGLPFWLRATKGAGAKGAIKVTRGDQAFHWLRFWQARDADIEWVAEEYLPGRDLAWSSVWCDGELVTSFARERLEYLYPHLTPEGLTGTPTVARIVCADEINASAEAAVLAVDASPNGIYSVDLKEDASGRPRATEINAGRGFTTFGLWSLYSWNFLDLVVRLARDGRSWWLSRPDLSEPPKYDALPEGLTLSRHIDCGHTFTRQPALVREAA